MKLLGSEVKYLLTTKNPENPCKCPMTVIRYWHSGFRGDSSLFEGEPAGRGNQSSLRVKEESRMGSALKRYIIFFLAVTALVSLQAQDITKGSIGGVVRDAS